MKRTLVPILLATWQVTVLAGDPTTAGPTSVERIVQSVAGDHPWMVMGMLLMAFARLMMKPLFSWLHWYAAQTPSTLDDEWLARIESSRVMAVAAWLLDFMLSIKLTPVTPAQKKIAEAIVRAGGVVCAIFLAGMICGCASFTKQVVTTDSSGVTSTNTVVDIEQVAKRVERFARLATTAALIEKPEARPAFEKADADLKFIEAQKVIDISSVEAIIERLDPSLFKTPQAKMYAQLGTVVFEEILDDVGSKTRALNLGDFDDYRPIVTALRKGIEAGL